MELSYEYLCSEYPYGTQLRILYLDDMDAPQVAWNDLATVLCVKPNNKIHVSLKSGRSLYLTPGVDGFCKVDISGTKRI